MADLAPDDPRHGKPSTYTYHACRCDKCRDAQTTAYRKYRKDPEFPKLGQLGVGTLNKALRRFAAENAEAFRAVYDEERAKAGMPPVRVRRAKGGV